MSYKKNKKVLSSGNLLENGGRRNKLDFISDLVVIAGNITFICFMKKFGDVLVATLKDKDKVVKSTIKIKDFELTIHVEPKAPSQTNSQNNEY